MAKKLSKTETLQEAKERVRKAFRPSDDDPIVRFIGENGKMGLRNLFSEEVVEAPTHDFIEMPEAEDIKPGRWDLNNWDMWELRKQNRQKAEEAAKPHLPQGYKRLGREFDCTLNHTYPPFDNLFVFEVNEKVGLVNTQGEIVLPAEYDDLSTMQWWDDKKCKQMYLTNILRMKKNRQYGFIQLDGKEVVPATFDNDDDAFKAVLKLKPQMEEIPNWGYQYINYLFEYEENNNVGLQTLKGEKLTEPIYLDIEKQHYLNGKRYFEMKQKGEDFGSRFFGLLDETGKVVLPCKYDEDTIEMVSPGLIIAAKKKKYGIFDAEGNPIVKCAYVDGCQIMNDSVIAAETSKDVTLFNIRGQIIIDKGQYVKIDAYRDGLTYAQDMQRNVYYIDLWGNKMA